MTEKRKPIAVHFEDGSVITLNLDGWKWEPAGGEQAVLRAGMANCILYDYSAADGEPGYHFAELVARKLDGEAVLPEAPEGKEGEIY